MSKTILIVDDSLTARNVISQIVTEAGYRSVEAEDGRKGLEQLENEVQVDLIISDFNMPWMTGLEMITEIKADPKYQDLPICLVTTESSVDYLNDAKKLGVNAFLVKPIQKEALQEVLNGYLTS